MGCLPTRPGRVNSCDFLEVKSQDLMEEGRMMSKLPIMVLV